MVPSVAKPLVARTKRSAAANEPDMISTLDKHLPVTADEVDVIEQYLGQALDELLARWPQKIAKQNNG
jgi:hypothetical protein